MRTAAIIAVAWLAGAVLLGILVGRFIHAGSWVPPPTPPHPAAKPTTYQRSKAHR